MTSEHRLYLCEECHLEKSIDDLRDGLCVACFYADNIGTACSPGKCRFPGCENNPIVSAGGNSMGKGLDQLFESSTDMLHVSLKLTREDYLNLLYATSPEAPIYAIRSALKNIVDLVVQLAPESFSPREVDVQKLMEGYRNRPCQFFDEKDKVWRSGNIAGFAIGGGEVEHVVQVAWTDLGGIRRLYPATKIRI